MAYNLETNPDGLGWRKVIDWNRPLHVRRRYKQFETAEEAQAAADQRLATKGQVCRVVPAL